MVTISSAQFQQQQQMISTLVQQQQEFKRMIQVLQEQQQQLVNLPMQLGQLHLGGGGTQDETMEEIVVGLFLQYDMYFFILTLCCSVIFITRMKHYNEKMNDYICVYV